MAHKQRADRRINRTRGLLHDALMSLIREKDYDDIVVKQILDRANVGRSTFYMHFRDKDDLLAGSIHHMLGAVRSAGIPAYSKPSEKIIAFSLPIFEHHYAHRRQGGGQIGAKGRAILHEHLRMALTERIGRDIPESVHNRSKKIIGRIPADILAQHLAATFVLVLNWWLERGHLLSPQEVNELFRKLILPILDAAITPIK